MREKRRCAIRIKNDSECLCISYNLTRVFSLLHTDLTASCHTQPVTNLNCQHVINNLFNKDIFSDTARIKHSSYLALYVCLSVPDSTVTPLICPFICFNYINFIFLLKKTVAHGLDSACFFNH